MDIEKVKELRKLTSAGVTDCKKAIEEAEGDVQKAIEILRKKGISKAESKAGRETKQGVVATYIHFDRQLGSMVEILCETDFVSRNEDFKKFADDIAMHIAAQQPRFLTKDQVPEDVIKTEREIYKEQFKDSKKPENVMEKIIDNKMNKYFEDNCLMNQAYVNEEQFKGSIEDYIKSHISKFGENIKITRFAIFRVGE